MAFVLCFFVNYFIPSIIPRILVQSQGYNDMSGPMAFSIVLGSLTGYSEVPAPGRKSYLRPLHRNNLEDRHAACECQELRKVVWRKMSVDPEASQFQPTFNSLYLHGDNNCGRSYNQYSDLVWTPGSPYCRDSEGISTHAIHEGVEGCSDRTVAVASLRLEIEMPRVSRRLFAHLKVKNEKEEIGSQVTTTNHPNRGDAPSTVSALHIWNPRLWTSCDFHLNFS